MAIEDMTIKRAISLLESLFKRPEKGLPEEVFLFASRVTPMVNVDLLIKDEKGRTLLAWRDDEAAGKGWHIPGGIVRFRETMEDRVKMVARLEVGAKVEFSKKPLAIGQIILKKRDRSHFISFLYACRLPGSFVPQNKGLSPGNAGFLAWHERCPKNLIKMHQIMYRNFIKLKEIPWK